jgi:hypothetical protein
MSPEQMRKKEAAMEESQRHHIYGAVDGYKTQEAHDVNKAMYHDGGGDMNAHGVELQ